MPTVHPSHINGKRCFKCGLFKPASAFYVRDKEGRLKSWCAECLNAQATAKYYADHEARKAKCRARSAKCYRANPERGRQLSQNWRDANRELARELGRKQHWRHREKKKLYRLANAGHIKARNAEYRKKNAGRIKAYNYAYNRENREAITERVKKCVAAKPDHYYKIHKAVKERRRVRLINQGPTEKFVEVEIFERDNWRCQLCGKPVDKALVYPDPFSPSLDHVVPVANGGGHTRLNCQLAHLRCNLSKNNRQTTLF